MSLNTKERTECNTSLLFQKTTPLKTYNEKTMIIHLQTSLCYLALFALNLPPLAARSLALSVFVSHWYSTHCSSVRQQFVSERKRITANNKCSVNNKNCFQFPSTLRRAYEQQTMFFFCIAFSCSNFSSKFHVVGILSQIYLRFRYMSSVFSLTHTLKQQIHEIVWFAWMEIALCTSAQRQQKKRQLSSSLSQCS